MFGHTEDPSKQGYTAGGLYAAQNSVLYEGSVWTSTNNPFETAPIHLHQLLSPWLDKMGASENQGYGCATTLASRNRPAPPADVTYTYPGNGATGWPAAQTVGEGPYPGVQSGPYLYVMFAGADLNPFALARATGATLMGPDGSVAVKTVDNYTPALVNYLPTGMWVIPVAPLKAQSTYIASVTASVQGSFGTPPPRTFSHSWSFTTGALSNAVHITGSATSGRQVSVSVSSDAPGAIVTATGPGTTTSQPVDSTGSASLNLDADGTWQICARSGGAGTQYTAGQECVSVTVSQPTPPPPGKVHAVRVGLKASKKGAGGGRTKVSFSGKIYLGSAFSPSKCYGKVAITLKHKSKTVATKTVGIGFGKCTFGQSITVKNSQLKNDGGRVYARFTGNELVFPASSGAAVF